MPPVSKAQAGLMAMASTPKGRAKLEAEGKKAPPAAVAKEFTAKGKGRVKALPGHVKQKKR
jgi:hypothetical protein